MGKHAIFLLPQQGVFILGQLPMFPGLRQPVSHLAPGRGGQIGQQLDQVQLGVKFLPAVVWPPIGHAHNDIFNSNSVSNT